MPPTSRHDPAPPSDEGARHKIPWGDLVRALGFLRPYTGLTVVAFVSLLAVTAAQLITPQFVRVLIDKGIEGQSWRWIQLSTAGLLLMALVRGVFNFLQGYLSEKASQGVAFDLRNLIFEKLQNLSFSYHDQAQTGQLMTRVTSDVENVRRFAGQGFLTLFSASITLVGTAVVLFAVDWRLALVTLATVPMIFGVLLLFVTRVFPLFRHDPAAGWAHSTPSCRRTWPGVAVVKAFAREPYELERYETANQALLAENLHVVKAPLRVLSQPSSSSPTSGRSPSSGSAATWSSAGASAWARWWLVQHVPELPAHADVPAGLHHPRMLSRAGVSATRVFEVLDAESEVKDAPGARRAVERRGPGHVRPGVVPLPGRRAEDPGRRLVRGGAGPDGRHRWAPPGRASRPSST